MILAGTAPTTLLSGTSCATTAPAATTEFSPTVIPGRMVTFAPIHALRLICTRPTVSLLRSSMLTGCLSEEIDHLGGNHHTVVDSDTAQIQK